MAQYDADIFKINEDDFPQGVRGTSKPLPSSHFDPDKLPKKERMRILRSAIWNAAISPGASAAIIMLAWRLFGEGEIKPAKKNKDAIPDGDAEILRRHAEAINALDESG